MRKDQVAEVREAGEKNRIASVEENDEEEIDQVQMIF